MNPTGRLLALLLLLCAPALEAAITASVDRSRVGLEDTLVLTLRADDGEDVGDADLSPLDRDFDIISTGTSSQLSIINGRTKRSTELQVRLLPRRAGALQIPPLSIDGKRSQALSIQVTDAPSGQDSSRDVFVEAEVDADSIYVQSQLVHTLRIYEGIDLTDRGRSQLEIPDAVVEELDATSYQRTVNGRTYRVIEVKHAIFPQKSGELTIPAIAFNGRKHLSGRSIFNLSGGELVRRRSQPITVDVKPIPATWPDAPWIPSSRLTLEESWSSLPDDLGVGDSVTRTITIVAEGIDGSQLPPLEQRPVAGIKTYPDQPQTENSRSQDGITGIGINSTALLITEPGTFTLPAISIPWWDTVENRLRYAKIPERTLAIAPPITIPESPGAAPDATPQPELQPMVPAAPVATVSLWLWTTVAALLGWLGTTVWLLWRFQRTARPAPAHDSNSVTREAGLFRKLTSACNENRSLDARRALQDWGQMYFNDSSPPPLSLLRQRFASPALDEALTDLEHCLYATESQTWEGGALLKGLREWRKRDSRDEHRQAAALAPLYSSSESA